MYTLRIIEETRENENSSFEQVIENFELGRSYCKIKKGHSSEFKRIMENMYPDDSDKDIKALVIGENEQVFFLMENTVNSVYSYFIMTDSGQTFERL